MSANGGGIAERSMGAGLRALGAIAGSEMLDRLGIRRRIERALFRATRDGFRTATAASRTFKAAQRLTGPARQASVSPRGLFDITPDEEQQMLQEAVRDFAAEKVRPAAQAADEACAAPKELIAQAGELGVNMLGVPEQLGGVMGERAAVAGTLIAEALAHGDMGIAYTALAPGAVAGAIGLWGSAEQQAAYLPPFTGEDPPAAALAVLEPRPLFHPGKLQASARRDGGDWVIDGVKSMLARPGECELFVVAAEIEDPTLPGPALFVIESSTPGLSVEGEPAMGLRAAATGRLVLERVRIPASALLGGSDDEGTAADGASPGLSAGAVYRECVQRARVAWCALALGTSQAVLDYVIPYVNERTAFGEPISNRQGVAFMVSDIGIETEAMRLLTYRAAARADQSPPAQRSPAASFAREAALARRLCAAKAMRIGSDGVQLLGGHGYVKEHPVERWYRDLRAAGVMEGALLV